MTDQEKARLLLAAVRKRFISANFDESSGAIITAIEGLKWIVGDEGAHVNEAWLRDYLGNTEVAI